MKSIFFTRFNVASKGHGGIRRTTQINDALSSEIDYTMESSQKEVKDWAVDDKWYGLKYRWLVSRYPMLNYWKEDLRNSTNRLFHYAAEWAERYRDQVESMEYVLVEDPMFFAPLIDMVDKKGKPPIIAFLQNIEFLSPEQVDEGKMTELLKYELELLKKCSLCITISREETFLLKNLGINVFYFPYYPPENIEYRMKQIRKKRENGHKKDILFVGTVHNSPTGEGLKSLIGAWEEHELYLTDHTFLIAGYGTETYASYAKDIRGIKFLGSVNDKTLDNLLSEVACSIIYQTTGSGALTKITEMLIANVPIIANSHAIRSYYNMPGIYEFVTFDEMAHIIKDGKFALMDSVIPNKPDGSKLIDIIKKTIKPIEIKK